MLDRMPTRRRRARKTETAAAIETAAASPAAPSEGEGTTSIFEMPLDELRERVDAACGLLEMLRKLVPLTATIPMRYDEKGQPVEVPFDPATVDAAPDLVDAMGLRPPPADMQGLMDVFARGMHIVQGMLPGMRTLTDEERARLRERQVPIEDLRALVEEQAKAVPPRVADSVLTQEQQIAQQLDVAVQRVELLHRVGEASRAFLHDMQHEQDKIALRLRMPLGRQQSDGTIN